MFLIQNLWKFNTKNLINFLNFQFSFRNAIYSLWYVAMLIDSEIDISKIPPIGWFFWEIDFSKKCIYFQKKEKWSLAKLSNVVTLQNNNRYVPPATPPGSLVTGGSWALFSLLEPISELQSLSWTPLTGFFIIVFFFLSSGPSPAYFSHCRCVWVVFGCSF